MNPLPAKLLVVTDRHQASRPIELLVPHLLAAGARWIWLRDRDLPAAERAALAAALAVEAARFGGSLSIGADIALAAQVGAAGVHLPSAGMVAEARKRLGTEALLGVSAHSLDDVRAAKAAGADYVTLSPIFLTSSKPGYGPALGLVAIERAAREGIPILALGGIVAGNLAACRAAGAAGIAVMGEIMRAADPGSRLAQVVDR